VSSLEGQGIYQNGEPSHAVYYGFISVGIQVLCSLIRSSWFPSIRITVITESVMM
jgi:hypothetical protein